MEFVSGIDASKPDCGKKACSRCPCMDYCPLEKAMCVIGGKWRAPILCALHRDGSTRYNELKRKIYGITNTMLASALKELEEHGLVSRKQYSEMPVRVEYSLTGACGELLSILNKLALWGVDVHNKKEDQKDQ
ncbi:MAG: helix-turn-helix transcriptional regulator [Spirochaetaceae bacterium]|jgi:DNA-binding HxlR family transcriptional regulator|nr:helix-turn-helix transcriptional regulator [Spirochaetaceae bacterium]